MHKIDNTHFTRRVCLWMTKNQIKHPNIYVKMKTETMFPRCSIATEAECLVEKQRVPFLTR